LKKIIFLRFFWKKDPYGKVEKKLNFYNFFQLAMNPIRTEF